MNSMYKTEQRMIIKEFLESNQNKFVNVEEIKRYLKQNNQEVGLTTIYRFLNLLEAQNNLRVETRNNTKYYQYVPKNKNQLFLKCKKCGHSTSINCKEFYHIDEHIKDEHDFKLDYNTIIYGTCKKCDH